MIETEINGRWSLLLPEHRAEQWSKWSSGWETERLASMADSIDVGDVVYDIGAEEGDFPALWASWGAKVVMVEPDPAVWPNIRTIFEANQLEDRLLGCHVGFAADFERASEPWSEEYVGDDIWPACSHGEVIVDHGFPVLPERPDIPTTTIDALVVRYPPPTHITIDVEGAELSVLRGARQTLNDHDVTVFVSVHTDTNWVKEKFPGDTGAELDSYMRSLGYSGTLLAVDHEEHYLYER